MAETRPPIRRWVIVLLALYGAAAAALLLAPFSVSGPLDAFAEWVRDDIHITTFGSGWLEFSANVLLFAPLGPSLRDVLANITGAAIGAGIAWVWMLRRREAAA